MKQLFGFDQKRVALVASFLVCGILANAQSNQQAWQTSKDVQRIANKKMFADEDLKKSHINAVSVGYPFWAMSKGVVAVSNKNTPSLELGEGNIVSKGYPMWTVSKGVARMNYSRDLRKIDEDNNEPNDPASLTVSKNAYKKKKK